MRIELNEKEIETILNALEYKKLMGHRMTSSEKGSLTKIQNKITKQTERA